jgi:hypothetical protein
MTWEFIAVADWAYARARHGICPIALDTLDTLDTLLGEPLKESLPDFALTIGVSICQRHTMTESTAHPAIGRFCSWHY